MTNKTHRSALSALADYLDREDAESLAFYSLCDAAIDAPHIASLEPLYLGLLCAMDSEQEAPHGQMGPAMVAAHALVREWRKVGCP